MYFETILLFLFSETGSFCVVQAGFKLMAILLPLPPKCWDYGHAPLCLALSEAMKPASPFLTEALLTGRGGGQ